MKKLISMVLVAVLMAGCVSPGGSDPVVTDSNVEQFALDLRDITESAITFDLASNPEHRQKVVQIESRLRSFATGTEPVSLPQLLITLQPYFNEVRSSEAVVVISLIKISLRRAGVSVDTGALTKVKPLFLGVADGLKSALEAVPQ